MYGKSRLHGIISCLEDRTKQLVNVTLGIVSLLFFVAYPLRWYSERSQVSLDLVMLGETCSMAGLLKESGRFFPSQMGFSFQPILEKREHWRHIDFSRNEHSVTWINIQFWGCWVWIPWSWRYWPTPNTAPWAKNWFKFTHATMDMRAPNPSVKLAAINKFTIVESLLLVKFHENSHALVG